MPVIGGVYEDNAEELLGALLARGPGNVATLAYGATVNAVAPSVGSVQVMTFGAGNVTSFVMPAPTPAGKFTMYVVQDGVGSRTVTTWTPTSGLIKWRGGVKTLSTPASSVDQIVWESDGVNWYGTLLLAYA